MPINENQYSIRCQIPPHIKMSALLLKLAGDATVRGTTTHDGIQVFSALDSVNLACQKMERMKVCAAGMGALDIRGFNFKDDFKAVMTGNTRTFRLHFSVSFSSCSSRHGRLSRTPSPFHCHPC